MMMGLTGLLGDRAKELLAPHLTKALRAQMNATLIRRERRLIRELAKRRETYPELRDQVRWTLYYFCKALTGSGELADLWRDRIDDKVVALVKEHEDLQEAPFPAATVVEATREAMLDVIW